MLGRSADLRPVLKGMASSQIPVCCNFFIIFRMKRANSLNVLNVGVRQKQDSVQVRRLVNEIVAGSQMLESAQKSDCVCVCLPQPSRLTDIRGLSSSTQSLTRRGSLGGSS